MAHTLEREIGYPAGPMRRVALLVRAAPVALLLVLASAGAGLGSASAQAADGIDPEPSAEASPDPAPDDAGPSRGAILMACFGVLFGGALALWQIRGMKNRG